MGKRKGKENKILKACYSFSCVDGWLNASPGNSPNDGTVKANSSGCFMGGKGMCDWVMANEMGRGKRWGGVGQIGWEG